MGSWYPIKTGKTKADWTKLINAGVGIDPYLMWADATGFERYYIRSDLQGGSLAQVAFEARSDATLPKNPRRRRIVEADRGSVFYTEELPVNRLGELLSSPGVLRLELGLSVVAPLRVDHVPAPRPQERVSGPVMALIDYGCAFAHENFRRWDRGWKTRIRYVWDQSRETRIEKSVNGPVARQPQVERLGPFWRAAEGPWYGRELRRGSIEKLLAAHTDSFGFIDEDACYRALTHRGEHYPYERSVANDLAHGTHVLDLAAGCSPLQPVSDPAEEASIIFVQLPTDTVADNSGGSMVVNVLDAVRYILDRVAINGDLVINLSYGSMAGPHDGSTILEVALDALCQEATRDRNFALVLPAGNSLLAKGHAAFKLSPRDRIRKLQWRVLPDDPTDNFLELWYEDRAAENVFVTVTSPRGESKKLGVGGGCAFGAAADEADWAVIHLKKPNAGTSQAMVLVACAPTVSDKETGSTALGGTWTVEVELREGYDETVDFNAWIERDDPWLGTLGEPRQSHFVSDALGDAKPGKGSSISREATTNSLANGREPLVTGGCYEASGALAPYSSAGPCRNPHRPKWPNVLAPAEEDVVTRGLLAAGTRSGVKVRMNGTSVAAGVTSRWLLNHLRSPDKAELDEHQYGLPPIIRRSKPSETG